MRRQPKARNEVTCAWRVPWWRSCRCCALIFKFEHAWVGFYGWEDRKGFVCLACAPGPAAAMRFFGFPRRPMPSPTPPQGPRRVGTREGADESPCKAFAGRPGVAAAILATRQAAAAWRSAEKGVQAGVLEDMVAAIEERWTPLGPSSSKRDC